MGVSTKTQLLSILKDSKGTWISGEYLSSRMKVTRSAIWKHMSRLREDGYIIKSSPKKGYLLEQTPSILLPEEITDGLDTNAFGKKEIKHFQEIDSTNTKAKELAEMGAPEGSIVVAEKQTKGRGRMGRHWFSPEEGGIYFSLILRPGISPAEAPRITLLAAVALCETLITSTLVKATIKWPNDILVKGKKVAGILTEISTEMDAINYIVVGTGLNVNTKAFPSDVQHRATSIFIETGKEKSRVDLLKSYLKTFEDYYVKFKKGHWSDIRERWRKLTDLLGKPIVVETIDQRYKGTAVDIDEDGVLLLEDKKGVTHRVFSGDISMG